MGHWQINQAIPKALRDPSRMLRVYDFHAFFAALLRNGMPRDSAMGKDSMSDKEACRVFSPAYTRESADWDDVGMQLFQWVVNMIFSPWLASKGLTTQELAKNALTSYYLVLSCIHHAWKVRGNKWHLHFLPKRTSKNILYLVLILFFVFEFAVVICFPMFCLGRISVVSLFQICA